MLQKEILAKLYALRRNRESAKSQNLSLLERFIQGHWRNHKSMQYLWGTPVLQAIQIPHRAWYTTGADLFTRDGSKYLHLVAADYYFKYPFVRQTDSDCAKQNQHTLENNETASYRKQGIPKLVRTKNGLDFNGLVFQELAQELNFENITSSPYYPHYNGFIKAKSVKSALLKSNLTKLSQTLTCCFFVWEVPMVIINSPHLPSHYCGVQSKKTCQGRFQGTRQMKTWPSGWPKDNNSRYTTTIDLQSHSQKLLMEKRLSFNST